MLVEPPIPFEARTAQGFPLASAAVQAGFPSPAEDHIERTLDLNEHLVRNPAATFFVRVRGDSMTEAGITSGDILVVDRSVSPADQQIVVAMLDGDFTVKRFCHRNGQVRLEAAHAAFPPVILSEGQDLVIWGVVTFIIHQAR